MTLVKATEKQISYLRKLINKAFADQLGYRNKQGFPLQTVDGVLWRLAKLNNFERDIFTMEDLSKEEASKLIYMLINDTRNQVLKYLNIDSNSAFADTVKIPNLKEYN